MSELNPSGVLSVRLSDGSTVDWEVWGFEFATSEQAKRRFESLNRALSADMDVSFWRVSSVADPADGTEQARYLVMIGEAQRCQLALRYFTAAAAWQVPETFAVKLAQRRLGDLEAHPDGGAVTRRFESMGGLILGDGPRQA